MRDIRQTPQFANYLTKLGWIVERKNGVYYYIRKFPLMGSFLKVQRPEHFDDKDLKALDALRKKHRIFQTVVEPKNKKQEAGIIKHEFKKSRSPYLPSKTLQLNLKKSKKELFNGLKKDARYCLRKSLQSTIYGLRQENDIKKFREAWKKSVPMKRYVPSLSDIKALKKSFGKNFVLLQCIDSSRQVVAGAIFLSTGRVAYYWQAFTNQEGRKNYSQYKIVWGGILWAKKNGAKIFDFEGIYDKRFPNKSWLGFTHFKKSFGGKEIEYPGAYLKIQVPFFDLW